MSPEPNLVSLAKKYEAEAVAKKRLAMLPEREALRREIPYTSWQDFLKLEAEKGNETALAVLRSRKEVAEPEQPQEQKPPVKNWMERGSEYAMKTAIRAEYAEKERDLQHAAEARAVHVHRCAEGENKIGNVARYAAVLRSL